MTQHGKPSVNKVIQYKLNNGQWQTWDLSAVSLGDGDKMYLKSDDTPISTAFMTYKQFVMTGSIAASGNIMSLLNFSDKIATYAFYYLFSGCTSLTVAPKLPATKLAMSCYYGMFNGCTSLTQAPELPATNLERGCYIQMFQGCTKLNYVKAMFTADPTTNSCSDNWLKNVSATGTFVKNTAATWTKEQAGIPTGWTVQTV